MVWTERPPKASSRTLKCTRGCAEERSWRGARRPAGCPATCGVGGDHRESCVGGGATIRVCNGCGTSMTSKHPPTHSDHAQGLEQVLLHRGCANGPPARKSCSVSLIAGQMQTEAAMKYHLTLSSMTAKHRGSKRERR